MSRVVEMDARNRRLTEAGRWVAQMDRGLTATDEDALKAWMADPGNAEVLLSMTRHWDEMDDLSRLAEIFPEADCRSFYERPRNWVIAASAVLITAAALLWLPAFDVLQKTVFGHSDAEIVAQAPDVYETAIGEQSTALLPDGTVVILNTNSRLRVAYSASARVLHLERGEIHVDVAHDAVRPLSVMAADRILQAVGTAFGVEITGDRQIELVVTEGRVAVGIQAPTMNAVPPILARGASTTVAAGEEIRLGVADETVVPVSAEEIEVRLSWREGRLVFRGERLEAALAEVERYTTVRFVFVDADLRSRAVTGRFRAGDVDGLLTALRLNFNIAHDRAEDGRVLLSSL